MREIIIYNKMLYKKFEYSRRSLTIRLEKLNIIFAQLLCIKEKYLLMLFILFW